MTPLQCIAVSMAVVFILTGIAVVRSERKRKRAERRDAIFHQLRWYRFDKNGNPVEVK